ncbi:MULTISPECIES: hypothetical protein [unclassified Brenneria]|uniref:hypothetical protein n=1 Tax=unclassified Brenneria TaxID=2634434 RepID=UPI001C12D937|nr:hypothetical protein [Brenneria sp. hezel4-2-4]MEE3651748.1 hypothetical protein [Brenneria sp. HEZEL_4_2_4]NPD01704.1 hypothetical protein [Brenneria sp. hezel4-2-4]
MEKKPVYYRAVIGQAYLIEDVPACSDPGPGGQTCPSAFYRPSAKNAIEKYLHYQFGAVIVTFVFQDWVCANGKLLCESGKMIGDNQTK